MTRVWVHQFPAAGAATPSGILSGPLYLVIGWTDGIWEHWTDRQSCNMELLARDAPR